MTMYVCTHKQTREKRFLIEREAFDLDIREWNKQEWNCTTNIRPFKPQVFPVPTQYASANLSLKCPQCGSYVKHDHRTCKRERII